uniref:Uncharacterized protein n=1 Tax=Arundo donax TaxID=35708 RepID=A0A0A9BSQ4_ARUDO
MQNMVSKSLLFVASKHLKVFYTIVLARNSKNTSHPNSP